MKLKIQPRHFRCRDGDPGHVGGGNQMRLNHQPGLGGRGGNIVGDQCKGAEGTPCPCLADLAEQTMLNRVPFRGTGGVVTDGHRQAQTIGHLHLKLVRPDTGTRAITATTIRFNQQVCGVGIAFMQLRSSPKTLGDYLRASLCIGPFRCSARRPTSARGLTFWPSPVRLGHADPGHQLGCHP